MSAPQGKPDWRDIIPGPFVTLIIGKRGGGKTATGHRLIEIFGSPDENRDAYIMGYPEDEAEELPEWIDTLPATVGLDSWPEKSVVLVHEAHHIAHARESQQAENCLSTSWWRCRGIGTPTSSSKHSRPNSLTGTPRPPPMPSL